MCRALALNLILEVAASPSDLSVGVHRRAAVGAAPLRAPAAGHPGNALSSCECYADVDELSALLEHTGSLLMHLARSMPQHAEQAARAPGTQGARGPANVACQAGVHAACQTDERGWGDSSSPSEEGMGYGRPGTPALPPGAAGPQCTPALSPGAAGPQCTPALSPGAAGPQCTPALPPGAAGDAHDLSSRGAAAWRSTGSPAEGGPASGGPAEAGEAAQLLPRALPAVLAARRHTTTGSVEPH